MKTYCGADCDGCPSRAQCAGCVETGGSPFGGRCVAAEYIKVGGLEAYEEFKAQLLSEINELLSAAGYPPAKALFELLGSAVNLEYTLPGGQKAKFLDDKNVYLGAQLFLGDTPVCVGIAADTSFILLCTFAFGGADPELILYKRR